MKGYKIHRWTKEEEQWLIDNWNAFSNEDIAKHLGVTTGAAKKKARHFKLVKSAEALSAILKAKPNGGQYQKGGLPKNTLHDNAITIRTTNRGIVSKWIRVDLGKWLPLQIYNWQQAGNTIPAGHVLRFKDQDPTNCEIDNLEVVSKQLHLSTNRKRSGSAVKPGAGHKRKAERKKACILRIDAKETERTELNNLKAEARRKKAIIKEEKLRRERMAKTRERELKRSIKMHTERKRVEPKFAMKIVDYAALISIRIDSKTIIYAKPGEDPEAVKQKYLTRLQTSHPICPREKDAAQLKRLKTA